jgi:hypothetical protein
MTGLRSWWDRLAGGVIPMIRRREREVYVVDGAAYGFEIVWFRRGLALTYSTPRIPRDVRRARAAENARLTEHFRRIDHGEPVVQVGDLIPQHAAKKLVACLEVRDSEFTVWKRAVGDERYRPNYDGSLDRSQEYDWIAWSAGEYAGGHSTDEGLLNYAPLTVLKLRDVPDAA